MENIEIVFGTGPHGCSLSDEAAKRFVELCQERGHQPRFNGNLSQLGRVHLSNEIERHDPILHEVIRELGEQATRKPGINLRFIKLPTFLTDFYCIKDQEGFEEVDYGVHAYLDSLDLASMSDQEKIETLEKVVTVCQDY